MPMEWSEFDSLEGWLCPNVPPGLGWWEEFEEEPELGWWGDFENNIVGHGHEVAAVSHINNAAGVRVPLHSHGHADDQEIKQQQQEEEGRLLIQSTQRQQPRPGRRQQRKPGLAWTVKEHKLFLIGLSIFGKGDWKSISRMCVRSRNPTQVASHAQKYFKRRQTTTSMSSPGRRRRSSIHDTELDFSNFDSINTLLPNFPQILLYANNSSTISSSSVPPSIMPHPADHPHPN